MDTTQVINAIQQVLQGQPLTRVQHSDNESVLNIFKSVFLEGQNQEVKIKTMMGYLNYVDTIIGKSLLTYQEHKFLIDGISYLKEEANRILKQDTNAPSIN